VQAWLLSREIKGFGVPTSFRVAEGSIAGRVGWSRVAGEPRAVEEPGHARQSL